MIKPFFAFLLFILCCFSAQAQKADYSIGVHSSIAIGDFGSEDVEHGAFAASGWGFLLENRFIPSCFPERLGVGFRLTYQEFAVDDKALGDAFDELIGGNISTRAFAGKYRPLTINFVGFYEFPISEKLSFDVKAGLGTLFTILDPIRVDVYDEQGDNILKAQVDFETRPYFNYMLGANLGYQLTSAWGLRFYAEYSNSNVEISSSFGGVNTSSDQKIGFINTGLAVTYLLK